ncbi:ORF6N domain-containing protein [Xenorhabdus sp. ZM]|uniref:ORF6N domain-containing protein n=2 Tax=Xenorhabdus szentirmaii TaxID=290112 RepID=UPI001986EFE8|nr:ORF6N domain-containing protein [Xenorhabdus sp. ZM]MBD2806924.1 ORF6N domain-containing protein [Xenorhabdus sp. ZM]
MTKKNELTLIPAKELQIVEYRGQRVVTTEQLAAGYDTTVDRIRQNFNRNKSRLFEGKHYFQITGDELSIFRVSFSDAVNKHTATITLWTERGAANHSKMLKTGHSAKSAL